MTNPAMPACRREACSSSRSTSSTASISFTAPLIVPAAWSGLQSVKAGVAAAEANVEATDANVLFAVAQAFYAAAGADEVLVARDSSISVASATLANAKTRMAAGTVTKVDVDRAELALVRAEQLERDARHGRDQAYRSLRDADPDARDERFVVQPPAATPPATDGRSADGAAAAAGVALAEPAAAGRGAAPPAPTPGEWAPSLSAFGNARKFNYDNFNAGSAIRGRSGVSARLGPLRRRQRATPSATWPTRRRRRRRRRRQVLADNVRDDTGQRAQPARRPSGTASRPRRGPSSWRARPSSSCARNTRPAPSRRSTCCRRRTAWSARSCRSRRPSFDVAVADLTLRRAAGTFPPK